METCPFKMQSIKVVIDGKEHEVTIKEIAPGNLMVHFEGEVFHVETKSDISDQLGEEISERKARGGKGVIAAPIPGTIYAVDVKPGEIVKKGKKLMSLMAMKMENEISAPISGRIKEINVKKHQTVNKGDILCTIE
jgi:glutaconyl-CoA/methylmalonyl-CoA decarboxylase subunit gamma